MMMMMPVVPVLELMLLSLAFLQPTHLGIGP